MKFKIFISHYLWFSIINILGRVWSCLTIDVSNLKVLMKYEELNWRCYHYFRTPACHIKRRLIRQFILYIKKLQFNSNVVHTRTFFVISVFTLRDWATQQIQRALCPILTSFLTAITIKTKCRKLWTNISEFIVFESSMGGYRKMNEHDRG